MPKPERGWRVSGPTSVERFRRKSDATALGRRMAKEAAASTLVVNRADGSVQGVRHLDHGVRVRPDKVR